MADVEELRAQAEATEVEDFDSFWSAQNRRGLVLRNVFGVDVELPPTMPLRFEIEARRVQRSRSEQDTRRMVGVLFGEDALDRWVEAGMDSEQFAVLLLWGSANVAGKPMTLTEAREQYQRQQHEPAATDGGSGKATSKTRKRTRGT